MARDDRGSRKQVTRRRRIVLIAVAVLVLAAVFAVRWLLQPENLVPLVLSEVEEASGLEITAEGESDFGLRGVPQLVLRDVTARMPEAAAPVVEAERVLVSVPWSTLLPWGNDTNVRRVELDAPVVDLEALRRWLDSRPPSDDPLPTLTEGIAISDGSLLAGDWALRKVDADVPELDPDKALRATLSGRYESDGVAAPFDVALAMERPSMGVAIGLAGEVQPAAAGWKSQATFEFSATLRDAEQLRLDQAVLGANIQYVGDGEPLRFALGLAGDARAGSAGLELQPLAVALRGKGQIPELDARGDLSVGEALDLRLEGQVARWPGEWPALPQPLARDHGPMPFSLQYQGSADLKGVASLQVRRGSTWLDSRFRLREVTGWLGAADSDSLLPPITGTLATPRLEISGAVLEGVRVQLEDPDVDAGEPLQ